MNIIVINGADRSDRIEKMKEQFLIAMGVDNHVSEYYLPEAFPAFCIDCRVCECSGISACPHAKYTVPLWDAILSADIMVFTLPASTSAIPKQMKELLDHYYARFMAQSADAKMFNKQAVVIAGEMNLQISSILDSIKASLDEWGIQQIHSVEQPKLHFDWHYFTDQNTFKQQCEKIAVKIKLTNIEI